MTAVWDHRQVARDHYVIRRDGSPVVEVTMTGIDRPSLLVREMVAACARAHGGTVAGESEVAA